ncbi:hypothetical protein SAMN05428944_7387 [Streptomyces sp. 1222.5]|uniref:hypothetical protein n=1 Tax=unclassified Streptomyces TaxID=2593676 RepID=UPI000895CD6E|nr:MULTISPECIES: hypothetical protein [unclassified Streptomyces]PKW05587.1 hypothetical protein BX260_0704 [Streptomyces sp. 5112.2]SED34814.1 hypothetical protein SAMN05428944_7387 [Streptomyces sp. 1222.5]
MTGPNSPHLDCTAPAPAGPQAAPQPVHSPAVGEPKEAARKGVVAALSTDRSWNRDVRPGIDPTPEQPGIRIYAPPVYRDHYDGARRSTRTAHAPTAAYACTCGQTGTARGADKVTVLIAEYSAHKAACTGEPAPILEGRTAA